ncbi:MAG: type II toxin-antitoxin system Phd/YefM family antitoxin [Gemmatimonadetes bacterium]|nr:type II toxin-antitoxin system Phd/YefM family antitoxin [Gemmatimonadota bacterium]MYF72464.1 type II toxin-antitoxin system Phd/YefM family antitoxin [Gemmatimonadota bacterium]MYK51214.1 type II toxin-antitoxin system Phd/YefM family antitoxin [Gemmatimonadota bacterium]
MRFIEIRDLRSSEIWEQLADEREMVLTAQGKPIAILSSVSDADWEETLAAFRRVRATQAVDELQKQSVENGLDKMDLEEVNREIQAVRKSTYYDVMASC